MHYLTQICKVTIAVFLTAMVAILFSTLTGCRGCSSEEEVVRWIPASRDTIPETIVEDSLEMEPVIEEVITVAKPAKKKQPASDKKNTTIDEAVEDYQRNSTSVHLWSDEFDQDSITLTIITSEIEMEITQNLN